MLALARGEASSRGFMRKIGHMRVSGDVVRQIPQPLQVRADDSISSGVHDSSSSNSLGGWPFSVAAVAAPLASVCDRWTPDVRMCWVIRVGAIGTILPGF